MLLNFDTVCLCVCVFVCVFILAKRVTDRVGGAQRRVLRGAKRRVSIRCRAERAKTRARGCESRSGFVYIFIHLDVSTALNNGADVT